MSDKLTQATEDVMGRLPNMRPHSVVNGETPAEWDPAREAFRHPAPVRLRVAEGAQVGTGNGTYGPGETLETSEDEAAGLIARGLAEARSRP